MNDRIYAILIPPQLETFCKKFHLNAKDIEVNLDGWHKHVLLINDKVALFPRNPSFVASLQKELDIYATFSQFDEIPLPKLIDRVKDEHISYYEFGIVTKLEGIAFSKIINKLSLEQHHNFFINLSKVISGWHNIPTRNLPETLKPSKMSIKTISLHNWPGYVLNSATTEEAIFYIADLIKKHSAELKIDNRSILNKETVEKWFKVIREIAKLNNVLIHGDIHEDQILINSMKITGIIDWETARIDNPVWDFNFGEWGWDIWEWSHHFISIRRHMWKSYLEKRHLSLSTTEGLHLFYTLLEFSWLLMQKNNRRIGMTKTSFPDSFKLYFSRLSEVNQLV